MKIVGVLDMAANPKMLAQLLLKLLIREGDDAITPIPRQELDIPEGPYIKGQLDELSTNPAIEGFPIGGKPRVRPSREARSKELDREEFIDNIRVKEQDAAAEINPLETTIKGEHNKDVVKFAPDETTPSRSNYRNPLREEKPAQQTVDEQVTQDIEEMLNAIRSDPDTIFSPSLEREAASLAASHGLNLADVNDRAKYLFQLLGDKADKARSNDGVNVQMGLRTALADVGPKRPGQSDAAVQAERIQLRESQRKLEATRKEAQAVAERARETGDTRELDAMIDELIAPPKGTQGEFRLGETSPSRTDAARDVDEASPINNSNTTRQAESSRQTQQIIEEMLSSTRSRRGVPFDPESVKTEAPENVLMDALQGMLEPATNKPRNDIPPELLRPILAEIDKPSGVANSQITEQQLQQAFPQGFEHPDLEAILRADMTEPLPEGMSATEFLRRQLDQMELDDIAEEQLSTQSSRAKLAQKMQEIKDTHFAAKRRANIKEVK